MVLSSIRTPADSRTTAPPWFLPYHNDVSDLQSRTSRLDELPALTTETQLHGSYHHPTNRFIPHRQPHRRQHWSPYAPPPTHGSPYAPLPAHWSPYAPPPVPYPHQQIPPPGAAAVPQTAVMQLMRTDARLRLRISGYNILALALTVNETALKQIEAAHESMTREERILEEKRKREGLARRLQREGVPLRVHDVVIKRNSKTKESLIESEVETLKEATSLQEVFQIASLVTARLREMESPVEDRNGVSSEFSKADEVKNDETVNEEDDVDDENDDDDDDYDFDDADGDELSSEQPSDEFQLDDERSRLEKIFLRLSRESVFVRVHDVVIEGNSKIDASVILSETEALKRATTLPDTYIGSIEKHTQALWMLEIGGMVYGNISYVPGLYKISDEILVNAADNKQREASMDSVKVWINVEENDKLRETIRKLMESEKDQLAVISTLNEKLRSLESAAVAKVEDGMLEENTVSIDEEETIEGFANGIFDTILPVGDMETCGVEMQEDEVDCNSDSSEILSGGQISGNYGVSYSSGIISNVQVEEPLDIVLDLITPRNIDEVVMTLKKEGMKTQSGELEKDGEYRQMLVQAIHSCAVKFPDVAGIVVHLLMDFLGDSNVASATNVVILVRKIIESNPKLRFSIITRLWDTFYQIRAARVCSYALWIIGEYFLSLSEVESGLETIKQYLGGLPIYTVKEEEDSQDGSKKSQHVNSITVSSKRPAILADGTYATQSAALETAGEDAVGGDFAVTTIADLSFDLPLIKACGGLGFVELGREVHGFGWKVGLVCRVEFGNGLIDLYMKCACREFARKVFDEITERDIASWNGVVFWYWRAGCVEMARGDLGAELPVDEYPTVEDAIKTEITKESAEQIDPLVSTNLESLQMTQAESQYQMKLKQATWVPHLFRVSVAQNEYMNEKRKRVTARAAAPIDFAAGYKPKDVTEFQIHYPEFNLEVEVVSDGESIDTNQEEAGYAGTEQAMQEQSKDQKQHRARPGGRQKGRISNQGPRNREFAPPVHHCNLHHVKLGKRGKLQQTLTVIHAVSIEIGFATQGVP